ncbi:RsiW-degrading membrane proteinase PrsW (M82 family) [Streptosporangium becharense]|uniref:RsiW-degrading membrane proteinase PrsW (M82 family) n=1 Tax=Streptosporangium becharense TaxID=1816182 RepID=A0A7W9IGG7_9ACTN|nr:PrsW family glutamic-type intramembrane protease [Streptosporangium becharense]MBB2914937.1 RsiW-degrading membrane proteinase PrsW (M82 family) [Streptosporangium becharense]MBB5820252.1 RsiW-degrading membrane proteinase PrsW (M82 family) [Streptosporangium becharense]
MIALSFSLIAMMEAVGNRAVLPAAFFYGAAAGPVALLLAIHDRTALGASVPPITLAGMFLFGGGVALLIGGYLDSVLIPDKHSPSILRVGWIEEPAKLVPPLAVALTGRHLVKAAGVALGLSCATGFAIMESMSYAWKSIHADAGVVEAGTVLFLRGLTTPFGHLIWTGLVCAVAFGAWQARGRVTVTLPVVAAVVTAAVLHSLNDGLLVLDIPGAARLLFLVVAVVSYWLFHRATRDLKRKVVLEPVPSRA